jgi:hypothetical protein
MERDRFTEITLGLRDSSVHMHVIMNTSIAKSSTGPQADGACAVDPVAVATMMPSFKSEVSEPTESLRSSVFDRLAADHSSCKSNFANNNHSYPSQLPSECRGVEGHERICSLGISFQLVDAHTSFLDKAPRVLFLDLFAGEEN